MNKPRTTWVLFVALAHVGCTSAGPETAPLVSFVEARPLVDVNPDPSVVEVSLVAMEGAVPFGDGNRRSWGYADGFSEERAIQSPGPLIEASKGDTLIVHFENNLPEASTTLHLHGPRLPNPLDGVKPIIFPGETTTLMFELKDAGTFWYHPHTSTFEQIERGLHGAMVVRDPLEGEGDGERVLLIDDRKSSDELGLPDEWTEEDVLDGRQGDILLVNGVVDSLATGAAGSLERWRIINAANGRFLRLSWSCSSLTVISSDAGRLAEAMVVKELMVAPGERYEVLVPFLGAAGESCELVALPTSHRDGMPLSDETRLVRVLLDGSPIVDATPSNAPVAPPLLSPTGQEERQMVLRENLEHELGPRFYINDAAWPFDEPQTMVPGAVERWEIINDTPVDHPFHIHGTHFAVETSDGQIRKDVVVVPRHASVSLLVEFTEPGAWMMHTHLLEHAELGMMTSIVVAPSSP